MANEDCYSDYDCDAKLTCVGNVDKTPGKCIAYCCPKTNEPCNGGVCNLQIDLGGATLYACSYGMSCELLTANACPSGYGCHVEAAAGKGVSVCLAPSGANVPNLGMCSYINDCGDMQQCDFNGTGTCLYYCALTGPKASQPPGLGGCPNGQTCKSDSNVSIANIGLCFPTGGPPPTDAGADAAPGKDAGPPDDAGPEDAGDDANHTTDDAGMKDADTSG
jgi:hypothetical protein